MAEQIVHDYYGRPVAKIVTDDSGRSTVSDYHGIRLGHADSTGTYDYYGVKISNQNIPGLLIRRI